MINYWIWKKSTGRYCKGVSRTTTTNKVEHCVKNDEVRAFSNPQNHDQKRILFGTNGFVLAHLSAKKIYNEQLSLNNSIQWYHMDEMPPPLVLTVIIGYSVFISVTAFAYYLGPFV